MREFLGIAKALSDESRLRALAGLAGGELCVCQIVELLGLAPSTVSRHMTILHQAGLIETRKAGRWIYCRLAGESAAPAARAALELVRTHLGKDPAVRRDARRLRDIRRMKLEKLCACYRR